MDEEKGELPPRTSKVEITSLMPLGNRLVMTDDGQFHEVAGVSVTVAVAVSREYVEIWRTDDCAAYESVFVDENGVTCSEFVIWSADGSRYREVIGGADLTTIAS